MNQSLQCGFYSIRLLIFAPERQHSGDQGIQDQRRDGIATELHQGAVIIIQCLGKALLRFSFHSQYRTPAEGPQRCDILGGVIGRQQLHCRTYDYDVIVIGAGNGGLSAAATTARGGKKTLVLERHNLPGGSATSFVRGRFEFESALHELCDLGTEKHPGTVRKLSDQYEAKMKWHLEKNLFHLIVPGKTDLVLPSGIDPFAKKMEELVPGCEASVRELLRLGAPPDYLDFLTTAQMVYKYVYYKPGQPDKKSHNLSLTLVDVIRKHGGEVWFNCEVEQILFEKDRAVGVLVHGKKNVRQTYHRQLLAFYCHGQDAAGIRQAAGQVSQAGQCPEHRTGAGDHVCGS